MKESDSPPGKLTERRDSESPNKFGRSFRGTTSGRGSVISKDVKKTQKDSEGEGD